MECWVEAISGQRRMQTKNIRLNHFLKRDQINIVSFQQKRIIATAVHAQLLQGLIQSPPYITAANNTYSLLLPTRAKPAQYRKHILNHRISITTWGISKLNIIFLQIILIHMVSTNRRRAHKTNRTS